MKLSKQLYVVIVVIETTTMTLSTNPNIWVHMSVHMRKVPTLRTCFDFAVLHSRCRKINLFGKNTKFSDCWSDSFPLQASVLRRKRHFKRLLFGIGYKIVSRTGLEPVMFWTAQGLRQRSNLLSYKLTL